MFFLSFLFDSLGSYVCVWCPNIGYVKRGALKASSKAFGSPCWSEVLAFPPFCFSVFVHPSVSSNSCFPLGEACTHSHCACINPPLIPIVFASEHGNEVHLRGKSETSKGALLALCVCDWRKTLVLSREMMKRMQKSLVLRFISIAYCKKHLFCCWCILTNLKGECCGCGSRVPCISCQMWSADCSKTAAVWLLGWAQVCCCARLWKTQAWEASELMKCCLRRNHNQIYCLYHVSLKHKFWVNVKDFYRKRSTKQLITELSAEFLWWCLL